MDEISLKIWPLNSIELNDPCNQIRLWYDTDPLICRLSSVGLTLNFLLCEFNINIKSSLILTISICSSYVTQILTKALPGLKRERKFELTMQIFLS